MRAARSVCSSVPIRGMPTALLLGPQRLQGRHPPVMQPAAAVIRGCHSVTGTLLCQQSCDAVLGRLRFCCTRQHTATVSVQQHRQGQVCQSRRSVSCYSTPGLNPPSEPVQHISWLQEVQVWCPPKATFDGNSSSTNSSGTSPLDNTSSSTSSNASTTTTTSSSGSNGSKKITAIYQPPQFRPQAADQLQDPSSTFDAIIVLAGGLTPDGGLPEWVHRRMDVARDLHFMQDRRPPIICSGGGTPHKPSILDPSGHVIHESTSGATYLMATGVQPGAIYKEVSSFDTVGNAYFSLMIHVVPAGWRRLAVVTSDFHMPRSRALFADIYSMAGRSLYGDPSWLSLTFLSASDEGVFDDDVYNARIGKEAGSLALWQPVAPTLPDLAAFHQWFHSTHLCYAVPRQHEFGKRTIQDQKLLDSY